MSGVIDDQAVRVICLDDSSGRGSVVFAVIDCVGISGTDIRRIRERLADFAKENNIDLNGYYSKSKHSAKEAAIFTGTKKYDNLEMLIEDSDAIFITTPDSEIQGVWNKINRLSIKGKLICHCSGSISSEIFSSSLHTSSKSTGSSSSKVST